MSDDTPCLLGATPPNPLNFEAEMSEKREGEKKEKKLTVRKTIRFSPEEVERLTLIAQAKGITLSDLIRRSVLGLEIPERISPERLARKNEIFRKYLAEINKIGSNLNQIARYCNQYREVDILVLERLVEIERELKELLNRLYKELSESSRRAPERECKPIL